ncbi:MAG: hypothetical protein LBS31_06735, partial [Candidatus Adiutrix sp.]|nr:hypothetical protein [Candidatus Adiutrix sp.]
LFHASGADARRPSGYGAGSWTASWGTLDFFIILIISIAVWKLYGRAWSLPVLLTLALAYHEPMAPRMIFLHLLATAALLRLLPHQGKARTFIRLWRFCAAAALLVMASVFIMNQARLVLHPQLENPASWSGDSYWNWSLSGGAGGRSQDGYYDDDVYYAAEEVYEADDYEAPAPAQRMKESRRALLSDKADLAAAPPAAASSGSFSNRMVELSQAPDAKVQNSQARPDWRWRQVRLYYNGGVSADQSVDLYLYGPTLWRILGLLRIILMSWFVLAMLETGRALRRRGLSAPGGLARLFPARPMAAAGTLLLLTAALFPAAAALAQSGFPDQRLLDEYRTRLLTKKDIPAPGVPRLDFILRQQSLTMIITVEAAERVVLELPNLDREIFQPARVALDGADDLPVVEEQGRRLVLAPAGRHTVTLEGRLKNPQTFQVSFPGALQPRRTVISADPAWQVEGLDQDGQMRGSALLATKADSGAASGRTEEDGGEAGEEAASTNTTLEPFFLVHRTISLGLEWRVHGSARRLTPGGAPVSLKLPLLPGETPLSGNLKLDDGRVSLNFGPADNELSWESSLKVRPEMELTAGEGLYAESWSLDVSPIWRVAHAGLAPVHNTNNGFWQPTWRPWPGEKLTLTIDRPQPVPGEYLVIDQASLSMTAGENDRNNTLQFKIRASQGGPYSFSLPQGAEVRELKMDGRSIPTAPAGGPAAKESGGPVLTAPLSAGEHLIEVSWVVAEAMTTTVRTPALDLGADCANITVSLTMPEDRWILWTGGPRQGPAVQFWSLLAAVLLFALALAKIKSTPLGAASWFLLGLGLIQFSVMAAMVVGGWLLALGRRKEHPVKSPGWFNLAQISLVLLTLASLTLIYMGIKFGLLQNPDMLIAGGGSYGQRLTWFTDRASGPWPQGYALSSSVWAYKALMLAWSLWLAVSLIKWLRWGWTAFSREGLWQKTPKKKKTAPTAGAPPAAAPEGR